MNCLPRQNARSTTLTCWTQLFKCQYEHVVSLQTMIAAVRALIPPSHNTLPANLTPGVHNSVLYCIASVCHPFYLPSFWNDLFFVIEVALFETKLTIIIYWKKLAAFLVRKVWIKVVWRCVWLLKSQSLNRIGRHW